MEEQNINNSYSDSESESDSDASFMNELEANKDSDEEENVGSSSGTTIILRPKTPTQPPRLEANQNVTIESAESALNEYFKLKSKYENEVMQNKRKIINNPLLSPKEKRQAYLKLKPKCINCKRPGGSIFSVKSFPLDEENKKYREFKARCGIVADPCNLNITIQSGIYNSLPEIIQKIEAEIKQSKNIIIDSKNKLLFGYITTETALQNFDDEKEIVNSYTSLLEEYLNEYISKTENPEEKKTLDESLEQSYDLINSIKGAMRQYNETENGQFVKDAVDTYINNLHPLLEKIMTLKYKQSFVHYNMDDNTFHLIQNKNTIKSLEYTSFVDKLVDFDVGLKANFRKQMKQKEKEKEQQEQEQVLNDESEDDVNENANKEAKFVLKPSIAQSGEVPRDTPNYDPDTNDISWNLPEYKNLWIKMPVKLKNVLKENEEWMKEFMYKCVNSKAKRQSCQFTPPSELKIPPQKISEDNYDFGVQIYNDEFNKLPKTVKDTYLTLYSTKDGVKNYSMLLNTMNNLVAKAVDFNRGFL